jgi:hypothetical protein
MFKRLKRIEALLTELLSAEHECLQIVQSRRLQMELEDVQREVPWKCPFAECAVGPYHLHVLPPPAGKQAVTEGEVKHE